MVYNLSHTVEEIKQGVEKLIEGDTIRKEQICDFAEEFSKASAAKEDLINNTRNVGTFRQKNLLWLKSF